MLIVAKQNCVLLDGLVYVLGAEGSVVVDL
jgi:hypothetical protein